MSWAASRMRAERKKVRDGTAAILNVAVSR
jgi:hypothetical protein